LNKESQELILDIGKYSVPESVYPCTRYPYDGMYFDTIIGSTGAPRRVLTIRFQYAPDC